MAHRKLQQEIDRVFKKINEGLEIFDTYYERHENCTNNPSQKDKLESDLKREVKKLQRLREQIKSWQSSPEIKDKDSLLDYRRSVEIAMEKYKAVEKASKEKAYSNISLKKSDMLDPEERERRDVSDYLSNTIDELERQYDGLQLEVDRLILLNKKKKTALPANEEKKDQLKALQARYRWHQQQMELALRLLANEELDPESVKDVQDDINYFVEANSEPDFIEDETIYEALDLQSNEAIAHEVAQYFASQQAEDNADEEDSAARDGSKISKKEQRRLEREAKKAAKSSAKTPEGDTSTALDLSPSLSTTLKTTNEVDVAEFSRSKSPSPGAQSVESSRSISTPATVPSTAKSPNVSIPTALKSVPFSSSEQHEPQVGHTHIHQSHNGVTTAGTLKPATVPIRPAGELKWAVAASQGVEKDKKAAVVIATTGITTAQTLPNSSTSASSAVSSRTTSATSTPRLATPSLAAPLISQNLEKSASFVNATSSSAATAAAVLAAGAAAVHLNNKAVHRNNNSSHQLAEPLNARNEPELPTSAPTLYKETLNQQVADLKLTFEDYESDITDDDLEDEPHPEQLTIKEIKRRVEVKEHLKKEFYEDYELLLLPSGIQEFIMGVELFNNNLEPLDGKLGGYRRSRDACKIPRFDEVPLGVNPPAPLDAFRSTQQWDITRCSLRSVIHNPEMNSSEKYDAILEKFRSLEMFTLFYNYYFAVTPLEQHISSIILEERSWKVSKNGTLWFLRQGDAKFINELCEVADYKIFKLDDWTVADKLNFKLDYATLKEDSKVSSSSQHGAPTEENELNGLSHGQQLLQQLKQGKISTSA